MNNLYTLLLAMAAFATIPAAAAPANAGERTKPDPAIVAVRDAVTRFNQASEIGDLASVMEQFDEHAGVLLVGSDKGEVFSGREQIAAWLTSLYKASGFGWELERMDIDHADQTAWVFAEGKMVVRAKASGAVRFSTPYRFSAVLVQRDGQWRWRQFHGSVPRKE